jgi:hypothetical protein
MLHSKYYFGFAVVIAVFPIGFPKVANAQTGYSGSYGGYYTIPGSDYVPPLPSPNNPSGPGPASRVRSPSTSNQYPKDFVQAYISGCARSTGYYAVCACMIDGMQAKYSLEELQRLYEAKSPELRVFTSNCQHLAK